MNKIKYITRKASHDKKNGIQTRGQGDQNKDSNFKEGGLDQIHGHMTSTKDD